MAHGNARTRPQAMPAAAFAAFVLLAAAGGSDAWAQQTKIWGHPHRRPCQPTAGGQSSWIPRAGPTAARPSLPIGGFDHFEKCPIEEATGFREIWFIYDDTEEYVHLARRSAASIDGTAPGDGSARPAGDRVVPGRRRRPRVQGYRIFTDSQGGGGVALRGLRGLDPVHVALRRRGLGNARTFPGSRARAPSPAHT